MANLPGGGDGDGGGRSSGPVLPGGGGKKSGGSTPLTAKKIKKVLRNAVAAGDIRLTGQAARAIGFADRDRRALMAVAEMNAPKSGFVGRLQDDVKGTITGTAKGIPAMAVALGKEVGRNVTGQNDPTDTSKGFVGGVLHGGDTPDSDTPFTQAIGQSFNRTGTRITHPRQALREYSQRPFSTLVEDAGNVAIVAGVAAKGASVAGMPRTAAALGRTEAATVKVANAPFLPVSLPARGLNATIGKAAEIIGSPRYKASGAPTFPTRMAEMLRVDDASRQVKPILRAKGEAEASVTNAIAGETFRDAVKKSGLKSEVEQKAAVLLGEARAGVETLVKARGVLDDAQFARAVEDSGLTRVYGQDALDLAIRVVDGTADPRLTEGVKTFLDTTHPVRASREQTLIETGALNPEQTGFEPLSAGVAKDTARAVRLVEASRKALEDAQLRADAQRGRTQAAQTNAEFIDVPAVRNPQSGEFGPSQFLGEDVKLGKQLGKAEQVQRALDQQVTRMQKAVLRREEKLAAVQAKAEYSSANAPARLRATLDTNRATRLALTEQENALRAAGLHGSANQVASMADDIATTLKELEQQGVDPDHFIHGGVRGAARPGSPSVTLNLPKERRLVRRRTGKGLEGSYDMSAAGQARAEVLKAREVIGNRAVQEVAKLPMTKKGWDFRIMDGRGGWRYPTVAELEGQGYKAWAPKTLFETGTVGADTYIIPKHVFDSFKTYYEPGHFEQLLQRTYDPVTRAFKIMVLPLSISWQVGNMVTNAFMATLGAGIDPFTLIWQIGKNLGEWRRTGKLPGPERLFGSGSTHEALGMIGGDVDNPGRLNRFGTAISKPGYKLNEMVDNMYRAAVYTTKKSRGYSDEVALKIALDSMGDFTKMNKFEKRVVRRVIPFYAWLRHMSQLAVRLPVEHPYRTAWILGMSNIMKDQESWETLLPDFMQGFLPVGEGGTVGVGNFMPFSNPFAIRQLGNNLNPIIKMGLTNLPLNIGQGQNFLTGAPYSRPPGTGRTNDFGKMLPTAPSLLQQFRSMSPQARTVDALTGRNDIARYESGDPVMVRGDDGKLHTLPTPRSKSSAVFKFLGVPIRSQDDLEQIVNSIIVRKAQNWKDAHPKKNTASSASTSGPSLPGG